MDFKIECLDHVALNVKDLEVSIAWYQKVLGLKKYKLAKWGEYPIFLLAGKTGLALFPASLEDPFLNPASNNIKIEHFAFNVTNANFKLARKKHKSLNIEYLFKDHFYFQSIYATDPDGHTMELTTLMVDENDFYSAE